MSLDKGSNGNKRKAEKSAKGSPNKRVHFADASTLSGIIQDDQEEGNIGTIKCEEIEIKHEEIEGESAHEHLPDKPSPSSEIIQDDQEEGNIGTIKHEEIEIKHEEIEEESPLEQTTNEPSTSSGKRQDKQAQEDKNWMRYIETDHEDVPKCKRCNEELCIMINPEPLIKHYNKIHPGLQTHKTMNWIFAHFDFVKHKQHLKCTICDDVVEVQFQGSLVDHCLTHHKEAAKQDDTDESNQGSHKDTEITATLIQYLFIQNILNTKYKISLKKDQDKTKEKTWSRKHWNINIENYQKNRIKCGLCEQFFSVFLIPSNYKKHIKSCHKKEAESLRNNKKWLTEHFLFRANVMWCTICRKSTSLQIGDELTPHIEKGHKIIKDNELIQNDDPNINRLLSRFINNLIDKYGENE